MPSLGIHPTIPGLAVQGLILLSFIGAAVYSLLVLPRRFRRGSRPSRAVGEHYP